MTRKARIGIDSFDEEGQIIIPGSALTVLDEMPEIEYEVFEQFSPEITPAQIKGFDMVITRSGSWTQQSLTDNNQLLCVLYNGAGYDHIDVEALNRARIMLATSPDAIRRPMAVAIITLLLALSNRLLMKDKATREGRWTDESGYIGVELVGKTLGSVGVGNIGHEMFLLAKPFGMKHIAYDPYITPQAVADVDVKLVDMDTLLSESDFLNISCPLNNKTRHLIGEKELAKMKRTAYLINTARGAIIDEGALIKALKEGWIKGAGIDVFEQEPTPIDNPLLKMNNVIVTPHSLGRTEQLLLSVWEQKLRQISQVICGEFPEALANKEVLSKPEFQSRWQRFQARK